MKNAFIKLTEEKQNRILDKAAGIFAINGYYKSSISEICQECEISNGALYKYFKNKEELFSAVLKKGIRLIESLYDGYGIYENSIYSTLETIFSGIEKMVQANRDYLSIYLDLGTVSMNPFAEKISASVEGIGKNYIYNLINAAIENGELDESIFIEGAVYSIDNLIILYAYSFLSEHYNKRLIKFIKTGKGRISKREKIEFMMKNISMILCLKNI